MPATQIDERVQELCPLSMRCRRRLLSPIKTEPIKTEPIKTEPIKTEPIKTEPIKTEKPLIGDGSRLLQPGRPQIEGRKLESSR